MLESLDTSLENNEGSIINSLISEMIHHNFNLLMYIYFYDDKNKNKINKIEDKLK